LGCSCADRGGARRRGAPDGEHAASLEFARSLGFPDAWTRESLPDLPYDAVVDASNAEALPALAVDLVEPGRRVVYIGLAGEPSLVDTREIALKDVTVVGVSAPPGGWPAR
jgi:D-arabinose 1-dehydrogenase-like Zn-dependent alcohol dehydrogenase